MGGSARRRLPFVTTALVAVMLANAIPAEAVQAQAKQTVYPTGLFPADVDNVQAAIDRGGVVALKASDAAGHPTAFNFGPADVTGTGVQLTRDVHLVGELAGGHRTTIDGGFIPILGFRSVRTRIAGISFESPMASAITLLSSTGTEITGNRINAVIGVPLALGFTDGDGIDLFGNNGSIRGSVRITGNVIENLTADFANGVQLDDVAASTTLSGNVVDFPESSGFVQTAGLTAVRIHSAISISGNSIHLGPGSLDAFPAGLVIAGDSDAHYSVTNNTIVSEHPNADGIFGIGGAFSIQPTDGAVISNNRITLASTVAQSGAISLYGGMNNSYVNANRIVGTAANALQIVELFVPTTADGNRFISNDLSRFSAIDADVYLGSNSQHTVVIGQCRSYVDLGIDNRISCVRPIKPAGAHSHGSPISMSPDQVRSALIETARNRLPH